MVHRRRRIPSTPPTVRDHEATPTSQQPHANAEQRPARHRHAFASLCCVVLFLSISSLPPPSPPPFSPPLVSLYLCVCVCCSALPRSRSWLLFICFACSSLQVVMAVAAVVAAALVHRRRRIPSTPSTVRDHQSTPTSQQPHANAEQRPARHRHAFASLCCVVLIFVHEVIAPATPSLLVSFCGVALFVCVYCSPLPRSRSWLLFICVACSSLQVVMAAAAAALVPRSLKKLSSTVRRTELSHLPLKQLYFFLYRAKDARACHFCVTQALLAPSVVMEVR